MLEAKHRSVKTFDEVQPGDVAIIQHKGGSDEDTGTVLAKGTYDELSKNKKYSQSMCDDLSRSDVKNYKYFVIVDMPYQGTFAYPYQLNKSYAAIVYK